jgi:tRNA-specific 2-thiouridylase
MNWCLPINVGYGISNFPAVNLGTSAHSAHEGREVQFSMMNAQGPKKVIVAMSGGVDSSVAAALLVQAGYDVEGVMLKLWSDELACPAAAIDNRCCTPAQVKDAEAVASLLGIRFRVLDVAQLFRETVVADFIDGYAAGKTPNPCVVCNREVRFGFLLDWALAAGADALASGHYVRIGRASGEYTLLQGVDGKKDQSYVLHMLDQAQLAHLIFPIGDYTKPQIRELAESFGLPVAAKSESQDICFLADGDYRRFLRQHAPEAMAVGPIVDVRGHKLGEHEGLPAYTVGQRKGLGISAPEPLYVVGMRAADRTLIVGRRGALNRNEITVDDVRWVSDETPDGDQSLRVAVRIRYRSEAVPAVAVTEGRRVRVRFDTPQRGISPGQAAVLYQGERCLGGGTIASEEELA